MMVIIGMVGVMVAIIVGYKMEHGNLSILVQPAELVIIGGAAFCALIIQSGEKFMFVAKNMLAVFKGSMGSKKNYMDLLLLMHSLLAKAQKEGLVSLETHIDAPDKSELFKKFPGIVAHKRLLLTITDNLRILVTGSTHRTLENLMDIDLETQNEESLYPSSMLTKVADALPGMGIVAAVLGVTLAMGKISEPPEVLGHTVAAALVGTFLGILLSYGYMGPIATNLEHKVHVEETFVNVIKMVLLNFADGAPPIISIEAGRRAVPTHERPSFQEIEEEMRKWRSQS